MIVVRIKGGLGNQLFQYATSYSLAKRLHTDLRLDVSFYPQQTLRGFKLEALSVQANTITEKELPQLVRLYSNKYINKLLRQTNTQMLSCGHGMKFMLETRSDLVPAFFSIQDTDIYIDGYYQSEKYFKEYRTALLEQFVPSYKIDDEVIKVEHELGNCNSIAVHVRRGDFLGVQHDPNPRHYLLGKAYYQRALEYMDEKIENPQYYWFSDDIDWVKASFGSKENFHFISLRTDHADIDEMLLMSKCKHIIAANSTFSWWAAWMNQNDNVIRLVPEKRYGNAQMIPNGWIKISVE